MITQNEVKTKIQSILRKFHVKKASLFGSIVTGKITDKSDIDILVGLDDTVDFLQFIRLKQELEEKLQRKVDLVEFDMIKPAIKEKILANQVSINL
jgi:predicted nucleotidyltransferase